MASMQSLFLWFSFIGIGNGRAEPMVFRIPGLMGAMPNLTIGTPTQFVTAVLYTQSADLIVLDATCGRMNSNCPRYCQSRFQQILCGPRCRVITAQNRESVCFYQDDYRMLYRPSESKSLKRDAERTIALPSFRIFQGFGAVESIGMTYPPKTPDPTPEMTVPQTELKFMDVVMADKRAFMNIYDAFIGIAPGPNNIFQHLTQKGVIAEPTVSIGAFGRPNRNDMSTLTIGGLSNECSYWELWHPIGNEWIFEVDEIRVQFGDKVYSREKQRLIFEPNSFEFGVPDALFQQTLIDGFVLNDHDRFNVSCNAQITMLIQHSAANRKLRIPRDELIWYPSDNPNTRCQLMMQPIAESRHADSAQWTIPRVALPSLCFGFEIAKPLLNVGFVK